MKSNRYTAEKAHADGRHESTNHADRLFWLSRCPRCALEALYPLDDDQEDQ